MIDVTKLKYKLIALLPTRERLDMTSACEEISWGESEGEISAALSFSAYNSKLPGGGYLTGKVKPNTELVIMSNWSGGWQEMIRGRLNSWNPRETNGECVFEGAANDMLYDVQTSQEYRFITEGSGTKSIITAIFNDWGIPMGIYKGPDVKHAKKVIRSSYIGDELTEILDDAKKKGAKKCFIRAKDGVVDVIPRGTNETVWSLRADTNVSGVDTKISTQKIVTRVVVMSKADDKTRSRVEATVDGRTEFGIHQRIVTRSGDETLADARKTAQEMIDEDGKPEKKFKLQDLPDIPPLRKGDKIKIHAGYLDGCYYVKSVHHYASTRTMTIEVEGIDT